MQGLLPEEQFAYGKGADCYGLLNELHGRLDEIDRYTKRTVQIMNPNFRSAFEAMQHELLISVLPQRGVGPKLCKGYPPPYSNGAPVLWVRVNGALSSRGFLGVRKDLSGKVRSLSRGCGKDNRKPR